jgi:dynein heavy chain
MDCYLKDYIETEIKKVTGEKVEELSSMIPQLFIFCLLWSIGTTTNLQGREKFNNFIRQKLTKVGFEIPSEGLVYDYKFDIKTKEWVGWLTTVPEYVVDTKLSFNEIVVPTVDSVRMKFLAQLLMTSNKHVLIPGPTGTGKSVNTA